MNQKYEKIFQPYKFSSGVEVKNRIMMAPMTTSVQRTKYAID
ncbi:hypothetical protein [Peribacillus butanolivorans]